MNSTTGDFTEIRKSIPDEIYNRGAHTTVKRKPRVFNLRPLNINFIKKELEEDVEDDKIIKLDNTEKVPETDIKLQNQGTNDAQQNDKSLRTLDEACLKDITNSKPTEPYRESCDGCNIEQSKDSIHHNSDRCPQLQIKENRLVPQKQKNDSFDLDFSTLSISTPVKSNDRNISITSNAEKLEQARGPFQQFVTPKINSTVTKNQWSLSKQAFLKSRINSYNNVLANELHTPYQANLTHKLTPRIPENSIPTSDIKGGNTFPNYPEETVATPVYNVPKQKNDIPMMMKDDPFKRMKVNGTEYIIFGLIGKGGSSEVYQCYNLESKIHVAIKCVFLENCTSANDYINEVKLLQQLQDCDKIIKMYDYEITEARTKLLVVLENGGKDLSSILKQLAGQKSHIPMYMLLFYWMEMLYAVRQIHSNGIIHSDLKPANFLKVDEGLKLIDFGIASSVQTDMTSVIKTKQEGSCNYISPEALNTDSSANLGNTNNEKYKIHYKSDVWSLGCILYQFVYKKTPFQHITQLWPKLAAIMNPEHKIYYPDVDWVPPKIIETIKKCLQYNVRLRPSVEELIAEYDNLFHNV